MSSALFQPIRLAGLELENRIVIAPMCQYSAEDGSATDWHMIHLGHLALSGAGLLILEATAVEGDGRISPGDLGLWSDANERALARVLEAIRAYSEIPVAVQLSHAGRKASSQRPWEGGQQIALAEGGWDVEGTVALAHALKARGCDFIHVSSGGLSPAQAIRLGPNYQVPFATRVKQETGMPTIAVGLITEARQAEAIVATGQADMVSLARAMLYDPRWPWPWPWHAAEELGAQVRAPKRYWRSQTRELKQLFGATTGGQR